MRATKNLHRTTETVVPTSAGLCPTSMAKKFNLPYFAKATKGFSLSSALVTEEIYVQAGTEAEASAFADFDKPWGSGGESFAIDAFGH